MNILSKDEGAKKTSAIPKSRQQIELPKINKHLAVDKNNFYQQRYEWLARSNDYVLLSTDEIQQEFQFLKREFIAINDEAAINDRANMKGLKHSRQLNVGSKNNQNREREIENNNAIIYRLKIEYEQLQKRVYANESGGKEEQDSIFAQIKEKIQKAKQKIKQLKLKSKSIGQNIQNGQDIFAEVNKLQWERDVQTGKKTKIEEKLTLSQADVKRLEYKLQQINEQHIQAERYLEGQSVYDRQDEQEKRLQNVYRQKNYQLQIVKKTIQSTKNTKQQKYHQLLKQLQQIVDKLKERDEQLNKLQIKNMYQKKEIMALEETLSELINIYKQRSKTTDNSNEPIFNGVDLDHVLQRDNSQQQGIKRKKMPLIKKAASPGRTYRKHSDFSIDTFRINEQKRKDLSSRTQQSMISELEVNRGQQQIRSKELVVIQKIKPLGNNDIQKSYKLSTLISQNNNTSIKSKYNPVPLNRGHYYKNYKNISQERNQFLQKVEVTPITNIQRNKFTFEQKLEQKQQILEDTIGQSSVKIIKNDPSYDAMINDKVKEEQIIQILDQQTKQATAKLKDDKIDGEEEEINKKKDLISNYVNQFQEDDDLIQNQDHHQLNQSLGKGQNFN